MASFQTKRLAGRGRCALASRTFSPGEVVLEEDAWAVVLLPDQQGLRCDYSLTCLEKLLRCPSTGLCFASKEDQKAAADLYYKAELEVAAARSKVPGANVAGAAPWCWPSHLRLAWRVLQRGAKSREQPWLNLESHWDELSESQQCDMETSAARCLDVLAASLGILDLEEAAPEARQNFQAVADLGDVARLVAAMEVNAMTVTDEELREIALGLYIHAAVFNHDEEPNCIQSFVGRRVVIRTIREVFEGEELCLAYAEIGQLSRVRHGNLWKHFHFRAFKTPQVEKRDGILSCVLAAPDWQPVEHGVGWDPDQGVLEEGAAPDALAFLKEVHHCWSEAKWQKAWKEATAGPTFRLGAGHALRLALARELMDEAVSQEQWSEALAFAREVCSCHQLIYPSGWPVVSLGWARLAKLELYHGHFDATMRCCQEALSGAPYLWEDRPVAGEEVRQMLSQARLEAQAASWQGTRKR
ncbi:unnamed protein product [Durusdinium trenchii]|uniref:SET domain-containing protein n=1 Tax=Durusdinium trenchii TaxID=1381693 RepID=A0ABP0QVF5_9DINO